MVIHNAFRAALLERRPTFGAWMQIGHPACAEILARTGFDWICVDLEHGALDVESMANLFRAMESFGAVPVARLPWNDRIWIKRTLDAGARGLIIPMVNSAEEAEQALREAKYPPRGVRGYGYSRANVHGIDFADYIREANDEIAVVMQIEHKDSIGRLDEIAAVAGVDALFVGPLDLSGSYGKTGDLDCSEMMDALARYRACCARHRKSAGMHLVRADGAAIDKALADGYTLIALGLDNVFLAEAAAGALAAARRIAKAAASGS